MKSVMQGKAILLACHTNRHLVLNLKLPEKHIDSLCMNNYDTNSYSFLIFTDFLFPLRFWQSTNSPNRLELINSRLHWLSGNFQFYRNDSKWQSRFVENNNLSSSIHFKVFINGIFALLQCCRLQCGLETSLQLVLFCKEDHAHVHTHTHTCTSIHTRTEDKKLVIVSAWLFTHIMWKSKIILYRSLFYMYLPSPSTTSRMWHKVNF